MVPHSIPGNQYDEMNLNTHNACTVHLTRMDYVFSNPILTHVATINQSVSALFCGEALSQLFHKQGINVWDDKWN